MPAVLRITGDRFALESIAVESAFALEEAIQSRKKRFQPMDAPQLDATYCLVVSDADGDFVPQQIEEADAFLEANEKALQSIFNALPNCTRTLDFSWDFPDESFGQFNRFPTTFLSRLIALDIQLGVSVYGVANGTDCFQSPIALERCQRDDRIASVVELLQRPHRRRNNVA